jgi:hypothetical protein
MLRIWLAVVAGALLWPGMGQVEAATHHRGAASHHLQLGHHTPVFIYALSGGFSRGGSFRVTIYGDGRVRLKKQVATSPLRLSNANIQIRSDALNGVLKLAEAERFFQMPARKIGPNPASEASTSCITIVTAEATKRACILAAHVPAFNELWAVLEYVSGLEF